jgi:hypothetical protein
VGEAEIRGMEEMIYERYKAAVGITATVRAVKWEG